VERVVLDHPVNRNSPGALNPNNEHPYRGFVLFVRKVSLSPNRCSNMFAQLFEHLFGAVAGNWKITDFANHTDRQPGGTVLGSLMNYAREIRWRVDKPSLRDQTVATAWSRITSTRRSSTACRAGGICAVGAGKVIHRSRRQV
jgi:hypothetical protein